MLTEAQVNSITRCIETGSKTEFTFEDAPLCEVIDSIIEHLEMTQTESILFGHREDGHEPVEEYETPEDAQKGFVHHAMHWAFQLGVGAALRAVGSDLSSDNVE